MIFIGWGNKNGVFLSEDILFWHRDKRLERPAAAFTARLQPSVSFWAELLWNMTVFNWKSSCYVCTAVEKPLVHDSNICGWYFSVNSRRVKEHVIWKCNQNVIMCLPCALEQREAANVPIKCWDVWWWDEKSSHHQIHFINRFSCVNATQVPNVKDQRSVKGELHYFQHMVAFPCHPECFGDPL